LQQAPNQNSASARKNQRQNGAIFLANEVPANFAQFCSTISILLLLLASTTSQRADKDMEAFLGSPSSFSIFARRRASNEPRAARLTKEQLGLLLAFWAQNKPDCLYRRQKLSERIAAFLNDPSNEPDNVILPEDTGAVLIDRHKMIKSVAGSGATHAAAYLCNRFPEQARGGTICLSKRPCTFCLKMMIQCNVSHVIVPELVRYRSFLPAQLADTCPSHLNYASLPQHASDRS
jgi:hypothetical protein